MEASTGAAHPAKIFSPSGFSTQVWHGQDGIPAWEKDLKRDGAPSGLGPACGWLASGDGVRMALLE